MNLSHLCVFAALALLASCATTYGPYDTSYQYLYGQRIVEYGDGRHPGAVFNIPRGMPVIAASDGEIIRIIPSSFGGYYVGVTHGHQISSWYGHLDEVRAKPGPVKRGEFIGISGGDYRGQQYLHFRICQKDIWCNYFEYSLDPAKYWLGGRLQCFERGTDYSRTSQTEMTVPLACGDYAKELIARTKASK